MGRSLELATLTTAAVGFIIVLVALFGLRGKAEYDKGFLYRCNATKFEPVKDEVLAQGARIFILSVGDDMTYGFEPRNRDRLIAYGSGQRFIHTWVHCSSYETCPDCLQGAASMADQNCADSYGVDVQNDDCEIRYETYLF